MVERGARVQLVKTNLYYSYIPLSSSMLSPLLCGRIAESSSTREAGWFAVLVCAQMKLVRVKAILADQTNVYNCRQGPETQPF